MIINEGFTPKHAGDKKRLPPGQFETRGFPVLSLGPTPRVDVATWQLEVTGLADHTVWSWAEFLNLPLTICETDIHCVTRWSKFDTVWRGVSLDEIIQRTHVSPNATHVIAECHDGYTTNVPIADVVNGQAWVAVEYDEEAIAPEHGGPARLLVPHLYFWKSAKWLRRLEFTDHDEPGFWETRGYHNYGDPWKQQRYTDDE